MAMKDLIKEIVQALVDQPDQVSVSEIVGENTNVFTRHRFRHKE
jgi:predicted RNA-binding protein YlqC (UPF0109 family)